MVQDEVATIDRSTGHSDLNHITETCCPPYTKTLCGDTVSEVVDCDSPMDKLECVVCAAMAEARPKCPRCGKEC